jgi:hypothetical protein
VRNSGYDASPVYTRDGKFICIARRRPRLRSGSLALMAYNRATGTSVELTKGFDLQVESWSFRLTETRFTSPRRSR